MTRVKTGPVTRSRHNKIIKLAKGYRWGRGSLFRLAKNAVMKAGLNAYRDRKRKKRDFRKLWILRISAFLKLNGTNYSSFMGKLMNSGIFLNRKILADLCAQNPEVMKEIMKKVA